MPMVAHIVRDTLLDQCENCGGVWLDQVAFERLTDDGDKHGDTLGAVGGLPRPRAPLRDASQQVVYLKCPDCEQRMSRRNFAKRSGVIIDVCNAHGIWFDDEELSRILQFVRAGGLDETRRRDLEELKEQERNLRFQQHLEKGRSRWSGRSDYFDEAHAGASGFVGLVNVLSDIF
jgi:Zn-finger nucleic acid-binding protein